VLRFAILAATFVSLTLSARIAVSQTAADRIASARAEIRLRNLDSAMALLRQVADSPSAADPSDRAMAFMWLGIVSFYEGDDSATAKSFRAALALDPAVDADNLARVDSTLAARWREQARAARSDSAFSTSGVVLPKVLRSGPLRYPEVLRQRGIEGRVYVQAIIDTLGDPEPGSIRILASPNHGFDSAVRDWMLSAKFAPGKHDGRVENMVLTVPVDFSLDAPSSSPSAPAAGERTVHDCVRGCKAGERSPRLLELPQMRFDSPGDLGPSGVHGRVVVRAVIDENGRLEPETISPIMSSSSAFERAVRDVLPQLRFRPAQAGSQAVAALIELRFDIRPEGLNWVRYEVSTP
jgi:TonB family protein